VFFLVLSDLGNSATVGTIRIRLFGILIYFKQTHFLEESNYYATNSIFFLRD